MTEQKPTAPIVKLIKDTVFEFPFFLMFLHDLSKGGPLANVTFEKCTINGVPADHEIAATVTLEVKGNDGQTGGLAMNLICGMFCMNVNFVDCIFNKKPASNLPVDFLLPNTHNIIKP